MCLPAPPNWPCTSLLHGWSRRVKKPRSYIPNMLFMMHQSVPEHWLGENIFFYQETQPQGCLMNSVACYVGQWHSKWSFFFFFLVWQILRYRIRGKIWLQCFRAFLQCALYLGDPVPISLLIINPLGNVRILSDEPGCCWLCGGDPPTFSLCTPWLYSFIGSLVNSHRIALQN